MAASSVTNLDGSTFEPQPIARFTAGTLKKARILLGWSQDDLARKIRVSSTAISNFECGRTRVLRPRNERALIDVIAKHFVDLEGGCVRLRVPRRQAAAE